MLGMLEKKTCNLISKVFRRLLNPLYTILGMFIDRILKNLLSVSEYEFLTEQYKYLFLVTHFPVTACILFSQ